MERRYLAFFRDFASSFKSYRHSVFTQASQYLRGLIQGTRGTMTRMAEIVPDSNAQALQNFLSNSKWDRQGVLRKIAQKGNALLGGRPYSILVIDETAFSKKGECSVGVQRQWNGRLGKVDNCQVAVFAGLALGVNSLLIAMRLYLPKAWADDEKRCKKAKIPKQERVYKSKTQLAIELVDDLRDQEVDFRWVCADAGYGKAPAFLRSLDDAKEIFVVDVQKSQQIYLEDPTQASSEADASIQPLTVASWAERLPSKDWHRIKVRHSTKGKIMIEATCRRIWCWDGKESRPRQWFILATRDLGSSRVKFSLSNALDGTPLKQLAKVQRQRYWIERSFQDAKSQAAMDEYQTRGWDGWHGHITLSLMAMLFMIQFRMENENEWPLLTVADIKGLLAWSLPRKNIDGRELIRQMEARHDARWRAVEAAYRSQGVRPPTLEQWCASIHREPR